MITKPDDPKPVTATGNVCQTCLFRAIDKGQNYCMIYAKSPLLLPANGFSDCREWMQTIDQQPLTVAQYQHFSPDELRKRLGWGDRVRTGIAGNKTQAGKP